MEKSKINIVLFFILLFTSLFRITIVNGQAPVYKNYTVNDGLPSQVVYCALQDKEGYMWFGTDAGASRFDGKHFQNFTIKDGLSDNEILKINQDSKGRIWFFTLNGKLSYYFMHKIYNSQNDSQLSKIRARFEFMSFMEDSKGNIWFGGYGRQLLLIENGGGVKNFYFDSLEINYRRAWIYTYEFDSNEIWIFTPKHTFKYSYDTISVLDTSNFLNPFYVNFNLQNLRPSDAYYFCKSGICNLKGGKPIKLFSDRKVVPYDHLKRIYIDNMNGLWLFTSNSKLYYLNKLYGNYQKDSIDFLGTYIGDIYVDDEGNKWFCSTGKGIFRELPYGKKIHNLDENKIFEKNEEILCTARDNLGRVWVGSASGGLFCLDKDSIYKIQIENINGTIQKIIGITFDKSNNIWGATTLGVFVLKNIGDKQYSSQKRISLEYGNGLFGDNFTAKNLKFDNNMNLYVSTNNGVTKLVTKFGRTCLSFVDPKEIPPSRNYCLYFDSRNNLWFENFEHLFCYNNKKLTTYSYLDSEFRCEITDIESSFDSILIISTYGNGIKFLKNGKIINSLNSANGLAADLCRRLFVDSNTVYVATNEGFSYFTYQNNNVSDLKTISSADGILSNDIKDICARGDDIYLATSSGLCVIDKKISQIVATPPRVYFTSVSTGDSSFFDYNNRKISYKSDFKINFIALAFDQPDKVTYQYSVGSDGYNWIETKNNSIDFSLLSPGSYTFRLRAKKFNSDWSEPISFNFSVTPPFYQEWWFRILIIFALASVTFYFLRLAANRKYQKQLLILQQNQLLIDERTRISSDMHDDLGADLSNLLLLTRLGSRSTNLPEEEKMQFHKLEEYATDVIDKVDEIVWSLNPSNDSINRLISFIGIYSNDVFQLSAIKGSVLLPEKIPNDQISAAVRRNVFLVVKEALNNAVRHSGATNIILEVQLNLRDLKIIIRDNGHGFDVNADELKGNGLFNMKKRIQELNGQFQVESKSGEGCTVYFSLTV